jgi:hypothetical protein
VLGLEELDAGEAGELCSGFEDLVDHRPLAEALGDGADKVGHGEGRLLLRQPLASDEALSKLGKVGRGGGVGRTGHVAQLAVGEAVLGRSRLPVLS